MGETGITVAGPAASSVVHDDGAVRFRVDAASIRVSDCGPVQTGAYLAQIDLARQHFVDGRFDEASEVLSRLELRPLFPTVEAWREAEPSWRELWRSVQLQSTDGSHRAWSDLTACIRSAPERDLDEAVEAALPKVDGAVHREVFERSRFTVAGRPAWRLGTWDRLTHEHRRPLFFVVDGGRLLAVAGEFGDSETVAAAFETIVDSIRFADCPWPADALLD